MIYSLQAVIWFLESVLKLGKVFISIDFELRWGIHHINAVNKRYDDALVNVPEVIVPGTLEIFNELKLRASWATVGAIALSSWDEYFSLTPPIPNYRNKDLIIDRNYSKCDLGGVKHFSPSSILDILSCRVKS